MPNFKRRQARPAPGAAARGKFVARAENAIIHDVEGRRFIDLTAGIGALNTGHRHPKVMAAAAKQIEAFTTHASASRPTKLHRAQPSDSTRSSTAAKRNCRMLPHHGRGGGNAVKIAALHPRPAIVAFAAVFTAAPSWRWR